MDIFNQYISIYRNAKDIEGSITRMGTFLNSQKHKDRVVYIRSLSNKKERDAKKVELPLATISGVFQPTRSASNLAKHSGFICIDIDSTDNKHFSDIEQIRPILESRPEIAYLAHSVSGTGYFALIRLAHPEYHKQHFRQLLADYSAIGINLDKHCGDVCRLRCVSFEAHPYINVDATLYEGLRREEIPKNYRPPQVWNTDDLKKVARCCRVIEENSIDITGSYADWFTVGSALSRLGEGARYWFHLCSSMNPCYSVEETDEKFTECLKNTSLVNIGTFFYICQQYGITYTR